MPRAEIYYGEWVGAFCKSTSTGNKLSYHVPPGCSAINLAVPSKSPMRPFDTKISLCGLQYPVVHRLTTLGIGQLDQKIGTLSAHEKGACASCRRQGKHSKIWLVTAYGVQVCNLFQMPATARRDKQCLKMTAVRETAARESVRDS